MVIAIRLYAVSRNLLDKNYYRQTSIVDRKNNTYITQAGEWKYVGKADFVYDNGKWKLDKYELFPVNYNDGIPKRERTPTAIDPDPELVKLLKPFQEKAKRAEPTDCKIGRLSQW